LLLRKKHFTQANEVLKKIEGLLQKKGKAKSPALKAWQLAVTKVTGALKGLARKMAASGHKEAGNAVMEINLIISKLDPHPVTLDQAQLMKSFLQKNNLVADVCLAFDMRQPLLHALKPLLEGPNAL